MNKVDYKLILNQILENLKLFSFLAAFGAFAAVLWVQSAPDVFEGTLRISLPKFVTTDAKTFYVVDGPNVVYKLSDPEFYSADILSSCGLPIQKPSAVWLAKNVKTVVPKNIADVVAIKVTADSGGRAEGCLMQIFGALKLSSDEASQNWLRLVDNKISGFSKVIADAEKEIGYSSGNISNPHYSQLARDKILSAQISIVELKYGYIHTSMGIFSQPSIDSKPQSKNYFLPIFVSIFFSIILVFIYIHFLKKIRSKKVL